MPERPLLSLCMIARDSARTLEAALVSIRPWVDEMVVVDTGSVDETRDIAEGLGARVFEFPWCDDFAAARNASLRHARGEWLFWMDSDDTIDGANGRKLRELAQQDHPAGRLGYVVKVRCPGETSHGVADYTVVDHVKLFRNHSHLRFEFRIHEQIIPAIRRQGGNIGWTDIFVVHSGSDTSVEGRRRKCERDLRILEQELADRPDHPFALFNFGMTYSDLGEHAQAAHYLERSLQVAQPEETHVRKVYALLVHSYDQLGRCEDAWRVCLQGLSLLPDDPELLFRQGRLAHQLQRYDEAVAAYEAALSVDPADHFSSIDPAIVGYKARHNLASCYADMQRLEDAERQWRLIIEHKPGYRAARRALGRLLVESGRLTAAMIEVERMREDPALACEALLLESSIAAAEDKLDRAEQLLERAVARFPREPDALQALAYLQYDHRPPAKTAGTLQRLLRVDPEDATAHHNLGVLHMQAGDFAGAAQSARRSLALRPDSETTFQLLEAAQRSIGPSDGLDLGEDAAQARAVSFHHDLGAAAQFAYLISSYACQGMRLKVACPREFRALLRAAGAEIVDAAAPPVRWQRAAEPVHAGHGRPLQGNRIAANVGQPPLPKAPTSLLSEAAPLSLSLFVADDLRERVRCWYADLARPLVLVGHLPIDLVQEFYREFLDCCEGTLVVLSGACPDSWRIRSVKELAQVESPDLLALLIEGADLVIGASSPPLQLAALSSTPSLALWMADEHPVREAIPSHRQLNLVLEPLTQRWSPYHRLPWNLIELDGTAYEPGVVAELCRRMLEPPRYLAADSRIRDLQLQHWLRRCRGDIDDYRDRHRSFDVLFRTAARRFAAPTMVETGTIRAEDDWSAGFFTYIGGAFLAAHGGVLHSVDNDRAHCDLARAWCSPFGGAVRVHCQDSVEFLQSFDRSIDVLYLDSVDTYVPGHAEHALAELEAALDKLHTAAIVVFDDTPLRSGSVYGKGALAIPRMLEQGWEILYAGYQAILSRSA